MSNPLVSILIPTYNRPEYLKLAIQSAISQTYKNIEIIISDDSNNEDSKIMIDTCFPHQTNLFYYKNNTPYGPAKNFKRCVDLASGDYISFLMDDDLYYSHRIEAMMNLFLEYRESHNITLVASKRILIDENGDRLPDSHVNIPIIKETSILNGKEFANIMLMNMNNFIGEPTTPIFNKKDIKEAFSFKNRTYAMTADMITWIQLLSKGNLIYIIEPLSKFRQHPNQDQRQINPYRSVADALHQVLNARSIGLLETKEKYQIALTRVANMCAGADLNNLPKEAGDFFNLYTQLKEELNAI